MVDEHAWLRNREDPRVLAWLEAENRRTEEALAHTAPLREALYREFRSRMRETDVSAPIRRGPWVYYERTVEGRQYPVWCRRPAPKRLIPGPHAFDPQEDGRTDPDASPLAALVERLRGVLPGEDPEEEILLDGNVEAEGHPYFEVEIFAPSPDDRWLAYSVDTTGGEAHTLRFMDLETGQVLPETIANTSDSLVWSADGRTLFYTTLDEAKRPDRAWRHVLGTDPADDALVHREGDHRFFVTLKKTRSRAFLLIELASHTTSEYRILEADRPWEDFRLFRARRPGVEYELSHRGAHLYVRTNEDAKDFRLLRVPAADETAWHRGPGAWEELVPSRPGVKLESVDLFRDHLVLVEREGGLPGLRVSDLQSGRERRIAFPEPAYMLEAGETPEFEGGRLRLDYQSPVTPETAYDLRLEDGALELVKREEVPNYDPAGYTTARIHATAEDGTAVPITLLHRKGMERDGENPCLLTGYGAYGFPYPTGFNAPVLSLVDRGFLCAIAHIRGGGELGEAWHEAGRMLNKKNTFTDFIACAEHLISEGWTRTQRLAVRGRSAGGLLVGAVVNLRPDLFRAVLAGVPFVDVYQTMQDPSIPLTVIEYEEWGNPADPEYADYIRSYSPVDNVKPGPYPHILATAGLNDRRVQYWEPARWVARIRDVKEDGTHLLLKTEMGAGHGGPSGRYDALKERALEYAFLLDVIGREGGDESRGAEDESPAAEDGAGRGAGADAP